MQILSTEASPTPEISFFHFLLGLAAMLAASILLALHPDALLTRWHPASFAAVHLFALGGLMPVMLGALFQFVPVACGLTLPRLGAIDWLLPLLLELGAGVMAAGFLNGRTGWIAGGGGLALAMLAASALRLAWTLWRRQLAATLVAALRRAAVALGASLLLALLLLGGMHAGWPMPFMTLVDWHAQWGIAGWVGGLVVAVAGMVVPMFHVTPPYPPQWERATRTLPWLLALSGLATLAGADPLATVAITLLCALAAAFGLLTTRRVLRSRRGEKDAFHAGWLGLGILVLLLAGIGLAARLSPDPRWGMAFGVLALIGLGGGTISVMLWRIVPFLIWLHWQRANKARLRLPLLHRIVPEQGQRLHLATELAAIVLLVGASFGAALAAVAAWLLAVAKLMQILLLLRAMRDYRLRLSTLRAAPARERLTT